MLFFKERRRSENPEKKLSEQSREPTTNSTHTHWREATVFTTVPSLLLCVIMCCFSLFSGYTRFYCESFACSIPNGVRQNAWKRWEFKMKDIFFSCNHIAGLSLSFDSPVPLILTPLTILLLYEWIASTTSKVTPNVNIKGPSHSAIIDSLAWDCISVVWFFIFVGVTCNICSRFPLTLQSIYCVFVLSEMVGVAHLCVAVLYCLNLAMELIYIQPLAQGRVPVGWGRYWQWGTHLFFYLSHENVISNSMNNNRYIQMNIWKIITFELQRKIWIYDWSSQLYTQLNQLWNHSL